MQRRREKVCVIGAGPAGIATAQQSVREGIEDLVVIERQRIGGLIHYANRIENLPGFVGAEGRTFTQELENIVEKYGIQVLYKDVKGVKKERDEFVIEMKGQDLSSEFLVLATGTKAVSLGIDGEVTEPEWRDYTGKIAVIGGGDAAYDYALRLDRSGAETVIIRRSEPKALSSLVEDVRRKSIREVNGEIDRWESRQGRYHLICGGKDIDCDSVVVAVGRRPSSPGVSPSFSTAEFPTGRTDVENLYAVGSLVLGEYRQTSLSWGMGIAAGMSLATEILDR